MATPATEPGAAGISDDAIRKSGRELQWMTSESQGHPDESIFQHNRHALNATASSPQGPHELGNGARSISRIPRACERCRVRKVRCNGLQPCTRCSEHKASCIYRSGRPRIRTQYRKFRYMAEPTVSTNQADTASSSADIGSLQSDNQQENPELHLKPTQWWESLREGIGVADSKTGAFQFYGPSSHCAFVQRVYERLNGRPSSLETDTPQGPSPVPDGLRAWGLERFLFSYPEAQSSSQVDGFLPRNLGERFIRSYFKVVHPQMPILVYSELTTKWSESWKPPSNRVPVQYNEILYMVLAIGARVSPAIEDVTEGWAALMSHKADVPMTVLTEPSIQLVQLFMLKIAFWMVYATEKVTSLLVGRSSSLPNNQIDAPYPPDQFSTNLNPELTGMPFSHQLNDGLFVRIMAETGNLADRILTGIYSLEAFTAEVHQRIENNMVEYESALDSIANMLPTHLNFLEMDAPVDEDWQEIQRLHLGMLYHTMWMLTHRPVLVFTTFFSSNLEAQSHAPGIIQLQQSRDARFDGSLASYLVAACITLLYEVLDPATALIHARETFSVVEQAIQCLDGMKHLGPRTGRDLSADIMRMAKNALFSSHQSYSANQAMLQFPWLRYVSSVQ
ncbi:hypothetical protein BO71DRAFT_424804 [Aspergillus ellipticus CBS 707.79]|uniref:Zn(2)-C6 fungal-type domain-containing protein n=1 Tax=Aspergillus ellipticus CBS 707.79 TaxID=1448320 RepID=A0A319DQ68_9EURO|nr:hypothetical protein BO71DRAFT_424804 [Aspergillus ellipticus CBS 707.79]